jgi:cell division protein FtsB
MDWFSLVVATLALGLSGAMYWHRRHSPVNEDLAAEVKQLKAQILQLRQENEGLRAVNNSLMKRVLILETERAEWQAERQHYTTQKCSSDACQVAPLKTLIVIGPDRELDRDLTVFRKLQAQKKIKFRRLRPASSKSLERYLERKRMDKHPVEYAHFSLHGNHEGLHFNDGLMGGVKLSELLVGVRVLVLDSCEGDWVADLLGVVPFVISLMEEIEMHDAMLFGEAFWSELWADPSDPEGAYERALDICPPVVGEFAELHVSSTNA